MYFQIVSPLTIITSYYCYFCKTWKCVSVNIATHTVSLLFLSFPFFSYIWFQYPTYILVFLVFCVSCLPFSYFLYRLHFYHKICFQFLSLPRGSFMSFFFFAFRIFICVIHYVFPSLLLRVYSANAFQIVFCVFFFQHLKFVQNFEKFPSLTISVLLSLHFTCCVSLFPLILPPYQVKCLCIQLMFLLYFHKSHPVISNRFNRKL